MLRWAILSATALALSGAAPGANVAIWRLDCGKFAVNDYEQQGPRDLANSCYLIRHGSRFMLWDLGLDEGLIGRPEVTAEQTITLNEGIVPQLARLGIKPSQITDIGVSHYHGDHLAQIGRFPQARLLIGKADWDIIKAHRDAPKLFGPWLNRKAQLVQVTKDHDLFGDGKVTVLAMPGHTPGHTSLLVRLSGRPVLLSGDAVHLREQLTTWAAPSYTDDKAAAVRSIRRLLTVAKANNARIVVQHDPKDIASLPAVLKAR